MLIALSVVGVSGLGVGAADPDIRETLADAASLIVWVNVVTGFVVSIILLVLRAWEQDLRSAITQSEKAQKYAARLHVARLVVVWLAVLQAAALMHAVG